MGKIGKALGRLIAFGIFASWFVFTIWGINRWDAPTLVSNKTTIVLMYVPLFIGMFILTIVVLAIGGISKANKKRKDKKKEKEGDTEFKGLEDLKKLEDVKDFEEFKAMIPDKWKEKFKSFIESQDK